MKIDIFESREFISPEGEKVLIRFHDSKYPYDGILDFAYKCAFEEYIRDKNILGEIWAEGHTWNKRKAIFNPKQINEIDYVKKKKICLCGLNEPKKADICGRFHSGSILQDDWNAIFLAVEIDDTYCAFSWSTSA